MSWGVFSKKYCHIFYPRRNRGRYVSLECVTKQADLLSHKATILFAFSFKVDSSTLSLRPIGSQTDYGTNTLNKRTKDQRKPFTRIPDTHSQKRRAIMNAIEGDMEKQNKIVTNINV